jgi:hypothetical protein
VCDKCNNYFSREVEKPFLENPAILALRFHEALPSKRGVIPPMSGVLLPNIPAVVYRHTKGQFLGTISIPEECVPAFMQSKDGKIVLPTSGPPPERSVLSRFLAKIAVETMAQRLLKTSELLVQWISDPQIDPIRNHARRGSISDWPVHVRRIYDADSCTIDARSQPVQTLHEFDLLQTDRLEIYFVLALFGVEMTINVAGPIIDGYLEWLKTHNEASPLYYGNNAPRKVINP